MTFASEIIGIYLDEEAPQAFGLKLGMNGWSPFDVSWPSLGQARPLYERLKTLLQEIRPSRMRRFCIALPQRCCFLREIPFPQLEPAEALESVRLGIELHAHLDKTEIYHDQFAFKRRGETTVLLAYIRCSVLDPVFKVFAETGHAKSLGPVAPASLGLDILLRRGRSGFPCVVMGRQGPVWTVSLHGDTDWEGAHPMPLDDGGDVTGALDRLSKYVPFRFSSLVKGPDYIVGSGPVALAPAPQDPCQALDGLGGLCGDDGRLSWGLCAAALGLSLYPAVSFQEDARRPPLVLRLRSYQMAAWALALVLFFTSGFMGFKLYARSVELKGREKEFAVLDKELRPLLDTQKKVLDIKTQIDSMTGFKNEFPRSVDILRYLTINTPKDTWIQNLYIKDDKLRLTGEGASAAQVMTEWRKMPFSSEVKLSSQVIKDNNQKERFSVEITLTAAKRQP